MRAVMDIHRVDSEVEEAYPLLRVQLEEACMAVVEAGIQALVEEDIHKVGNRNAENEDDASLVLVQVGSRGVRIGLGDRPDALLDQSLRIQVKEIPWPFCKSLVRLKELYNEVKSVISTLLCCVSFSTT